MTATVIVDRRDDLPTRLDPRRLYIVGRPHKWAVMRCPCGTGHVVELNIANPHRPRWVVTANQPSRPTLHPSIDVRSSPRCHFWLRSGRVEWC